MRSVGSVLVKGVARKNINSAKLIRNFNPFTASNTFKHTLFKSSLFNKSFYFFSKINSHADHNHHK